jgi:hypothetical protein
MSESSKVIRLTSFTDISECLKPQLDRKYIYTEEPNVSILRSDYIPHLADQCP